MINALHSITRMVQADPAMGVLLLGFVLALVSYVGPGSRFGKHWHPAGAWNSATYLLGALCIAGALIFLCLRGLWHLLRGVF